MFNGLDLKGSNQDLAINTSSWKRENPCPVLGKSDEGCSLN